MLEIHSLSKSYGNKVIVEDWSYSFEDGKIYGLIGRNGIGKTTLLKCISGLCMPDRADIRSSKGDLSEKDYLDRDIVYISDEPIFYNDLTLQEHLWLICKVEKYSKQEAKKKIDYYLECLKMKEYMAFYPSALSKGTLQRMMLIMGFLRKADNLLLDEPFNGLDPVQLAETVQICTRESAKRCIIISSHDIESLAEICDEYLIFNAKRIERLSKEISREEIKRMIGESYV